MSHEAKTGTEKKPVTTTAKRKREPSKIGQFILKHKLNFSLLFALIVVFAWAQWKIGRLEKAQNKLIESYEQKMDSLKKADYLQMTEVLSWAVRNDMMQNNFDFSSQYALKLIRENSSIKKVYAVSSESSKVVFSSEPDETGKVIADFTSSQSLTEVIMEVGEMTRFVAPITGIDRHIGACVIEAEFR